MQTGQFRTDQDALLAAIFAAPADDAPRLIYADWLEEHGDDTVAEFIRLRCELVGLHNGDRRWRPLRRRLHWVWDALQVQWKAQFPRTKLTIEHFPRGIPTKLVESTGQAIIHESDRWWPTIPIRILRPTQWVSFAAQVSQCPYLQRLDVLDLTHQTVDIESARAIGRSPYLHDLKTLWVSNWSSIGDVLQLLGCRFGSRMKIWDKRCPPPF